MTVPPRASRAGTGVDARGFAAYAALAASAHLADPGGTRRTGRAAGAAVGLGTRSALAARAASAAAAHGHHRAVLARAGLDPAAAMTPAAGPVDAVWAVVDGAAGDAAVVLAHLAAGIVDDLVAVALAADGGADDDGDGGADDDGDGGADDDGDGGVGGGGVGGGDVGRGGVGGGPGDGADGSSCDVAADDASSAVRAAVAAVAADPRDAARLALGARRVLGEALAAAVAVLGAPPPAAALKALKSQHRRRGAAVGL